MKKSFALLLSFTALALCGAGCHAGAMWNGHGSPTLNGSVSIPLGGGAGGGGGGPR